MIQGTDPANLPLRDIHLPEAIFWWPPALGWWLMFFLLIAIVAMTIFFIRRRREHRLSAVYLAQQELDQIKYNYNASQDKSSLVQELSKLIRRISISVFKRSDTASLTGQDWLMFLDKFASNNDFSQGVGRVLIEAPYQVSPDYDSTELLALIAAWLDSVKNNKGKKAYDKF